MAEVASVPLRMYMCSFIFAFCCCFFSSAQQEKTCVMLDAIRRARLKQLRGPRSQAPKVPKASHTCLECPAVHKDCDALIMHRLRHIEGKHWPCPVRFC